MTRGVQQRAAVAAAAAVLLVGGVLIGILVFGRAVPPAFPPLAAQPDPAIPGLVAFLRDRTRDGSACVYVVPASGGVPRELRCGAFLHGPLEWTDEGSLGVALATTGPRAQLLLLDPRTGAVKGRRAALDPVTDRPDGGATRADGTTAAVSSTGGRVQLHLIGPAGEERTLVHLPAPRGYHWFQVRWSPDGRWLLVEDSEQRLLLVSARTGAVRLLAEEAHSPAWSPPRA